MNFKKKKTEEIQKEKKVLAIKSLPNTDHFKIKSTKDIIVDEVEKNELMELDEDQAPLPRKKKNLFDFYEPPEELNDNSIENKNLEVIENLEQKINDLEVTLEEQQKEITELEADNKLLIELTIDIELLKRSIESAKKLREEDKLKTVTEHLLDVYQKNILEIFGKKNDKKEN